MGYRSQVGLCVTQKAAARLHDTMAQATDGNDKLFLLYNADTHSVDPCSGAELWVWDWVKWYDEYPEVSFIVGFMSTLEWEEHLFIRIGEDSDDNEISGAFWENPFEMALVRDISMSLSD